MTVSYNNPQQYGQMANNPFNSEVTQYENPQLYQNNGYQYNIQPYNRSRVPAIIGATAAGAAAGFVGGVIIGAGKDYITSMRPVKNNEVKTSFAKRVLERIIKKDYTAKGKEFFKQKHELLKKLGRINSVEEFTKLMENNKKYAQTLCDGISLNSMCKMVTKDNLKDKIAALKKRIEASIEPELQNIKDSVKLCWDSENKKFVKPKSVDEKLFKIIKGTKNNVEWKHILKYGGIGAAILAVGTLALAFLPGKTREY